MRLARRAAVLACLLLTGACAPSKVERLVSMTDFAFQPRTLEVPRGAEVVLTLVNRGTHEHVLVLLDKDQPVALPLAIDESNVLARVDVDVGGRETVTLRAPEEPGVYPVVCTFPGHAEAGMIGAWEVR
jgi:uncharacterized cupredoxin-like copper-binding protein